MAAAPIRAPAPGLAEAVDRSVVRKNIDLRYAMNVIPLDPSCVRGTHGRRPETADGTPVIVTSGSDRLAGRTRMKLTDVRDLVLSAHSDDAVVGAAVRPGGR